MSDTFGENDRFYESDILQRMYGSLAVCHTTKSHFLIANNINIG